MAPAIGEAGMGGVEYRVVPAPRRGIKARGARTAEERFAAALSELMNALGAEGWDYVRSDVLPCEERQGLTGRTTVYHTMLVFRRALPAEGAGTAGMAPPRLALAPAAVPAAAPGAVPAAAAEAERPAGPPPLPSPAALPGFLAPGPRAVTPPLNPAPPLGPAERRGTE
jgi:hypothetical protein